MSKSEEYGDEALLALWSQGPGQWLYRVKKHIAKLVPVSEQGYLRVRVTLILTEENGVIVEGNTTEFYYRDWYSGNKIAPAGLLGNSFRFEVTASWAEVAGKHIELVPRFPDDVLPHSPEAMDLLIGGILSDAHTQVGPRTKAGAEGIIFKFTQSGAHSEFAL